ncbi:MAG: sigma-70 family RNA polymerase sigma factor [Lachnospiraceae bacterium]|nr:sigma-70 family RNA polymerase sigma factor [Lachnospiraceae bacterium]
MYCSNCGKEIQEDWKFCNFCGNQLGTAIEEAVRLAWQGDERGFSLLYERSYGRSYQAAVHILGTREAAEDVLQESYIKAMKKIKNLREPAAFLSWMDKIVTNTAIDVLRREKSMPALVNEEGEDIDVEDVDQEFQPEQQFTRRETQDTIRMLMQELSEIQRTCLIMRHVQHMSYKDISEMLGVPLGTVKSRLNYAEKSLLKKANALKAQGVPLYSITPFLAYLFKMELQYLEADGTIAQSSAAVAESIAIAAPGLITKGVYSGGKLYSAAHAGAGMEKAGGAARIGSKSGSSSAGGSAAADLTSEAGGSATADITSTARGTAAAAKKSFVSWKLAASIAVGAAVGVGAAAVGLHFTGTAPESAAVTETEPAAEITEISETQVEESGRAPFSEQTVMPEEEQRSVLAQLAVTNMSESRSDAFVLDKDGVLTYEIGDITGEGSSFDAYDENMAILYLFSDEELRDLSLSGMLAYEDCFTELEFAYCGRITSGEVKQLVFPDKKYEFIVNESGRLTECVITENENVSGISYTYNDRGRLILAENSDPDGLYGTLEFRYSDELEHDDEYVGPAKRIILLDRNKPWFFYILPQYNGGSFDLSNNDLISDVVYEAGQNEDWTYIDWVYSYYDDGKISNIYLNPVSGSLPDTTESRSYSYSEDGSLSSVEAVNWRGTGQSLAYGRFVQDETEAAAGNEETAELPAAVNDEELDRRALELYTQLLEYCDSDPEAYRNLFVNTPEEYIENSKAECIAVAQQHYEKNAAAVILRYGDYYLIAAESYSVAGTHPDNSVKSEWISPILAVETENGLKIEINDGVSEILSDEKILEFIYGEKLVTAMNEGRNADAFQRPLLFLSQHAYEEGFLAENTLYLWQNEDQSIDLALEIGNGTDGARMIHSGRIQLIDDQLGTIVDVDVPINEMISTGDHKVCILHIDAKDVQTGAEPWTKLESSFVFHFD